MNDYKKINFQYKSNKRTIKKKNTLNKYNSTFKILKFIINKNTVNKKENLKYRYIISNLLKLFLFNCILPLYLSKENINQLRNLNSNPKISITVKGDFEIKIISDDSKLNPSKVYYTNNKIGIFYRNKKINLGTFYIKNYEYNITMEFYSQIYSFKGLFSDLSSIIKVDLSKFNQKVVDMSSMFKNCENIEYINFGNFDTSLVTNLEHMFNGCNITILNLSNFNTSSVTSTKYMFSNCKNLISLDLTSFNTSSIIKMQYMFSNCESLIFLNLFSFNENENIEIENIFKNTPDDLIYCINEQEAQKIALELRNKTTKNNCENTCFKKSFEIILEKKMCIESFSLDENYTYEENSILYNSEELNKDTETNENFSTYKITEKMENVISDIDTTESKIDTLDISTQEKKSDLNSEELKIVETITVTEELKNFLTDIITKELKNSITDKITEEMKIKGTEEITEKNEIIRNNEILENCTAENFFKGLCETKNQTDSLENKDIIINNIIENIINGNLDNLIENITKDKKDYYIKEDDVIFQITNSDNQNNNEYSNVSSINLGECEGILKEKYNISKNQSLIILKVDYFMPGILIPIIGYEVFDPINKTKLDLNFCKDFIINYNIPVSIDENNIDKYNPNSDYYNDECSTYTTEDGTDITLNDRQNEYNKNNMSLCENNCNFTEYDKDTKKSKCICEIKSKIFSISDIIQNNETVLETFNNSKSTSLTNVNIMKCFDTLFSKYGLLKNIGNYILIAIILIFAISCILFYKIGYNLLENDIKEIIFSKEKRDKKMSEKNVNIYTNEMKNEAKLIRKNKKKKSSKKLKVLGSNPIKKKKNEEFVESTNMSKDINTYKSFLKLNSNLININGSNKDINSKFNKIIDKPKFNNKSIYSDLELNSLNYKDALVYDKRTNKQYYISLIKFKHPLIFGFFPIKDYNTIIIKNDIFFLSFAINYAINALFFNEATIHQIYADKGSYNFSYFLPKALFSFIFSHIINIMIKYIFLSQRNLLKLKIQESRKKALELVDSVKRCIIIKYIFFYLLSNLFLIFFWYYLSAFCAVFQNTQIFLIINTFISFSISLVYPFFINLLPVFLRSFSLSQSNRKCFFQINKFIQII